MLLEELQRWLPTILVLVGFVLAGFILRIVLDLGMTRVIRKSKTKIDDIIVNAIRTPVLIIFLIFGLELAFETAPSRPSVLVDILPLLFHTLVVLAVAISAVKAINGLLKHYGTMRPALKSVVPTLQKVVRFIIAIVTLLLILDGLGVNVTAAAAALGIAGIAIAFALQGTLSEFFAGLYIMADRPIRVGDYVRLETGQEGYVADIGWRSIKIRELPNNIIVIPNSKVASSIVTNYYLPETEMACLVQVGVSYDSDLEKVERVTIDVAKKVLKKVSGGVPDFEPFIRYHTFSDFSINFTVILRVKEYVDKYLVTHEFVKELHKRYKEEGIEIPFPIRTVYLRRKRA